MSLFTSAARGGSVTVVAQGLRFGIQTVGLVVLSRLLLPGDFGLAAMVGAVTGIAFIVGDGGLSIAALQAKTLTTKQQSNLFWANALIGTVLCCVLYAVAGPVGHLCNDSRVAGAIRVTSTVFLLNGLTTQFRTRLNRQLRFGLIAGVDIGGQALGLIVAIALAIGGARYWALIVQQVVIAALALLAYAGFARWKPALPSRRAGTRGLFVVGTSTLGVQVLNYLSVNVATIFLGRSWGAFVVGTYSRAFNIFAMPMTQLAAPLTRVSLPLFAMLEDRAVTVRQLLNAQRVMCHPLMAIFAGVAGASSALVPIMFGSGWLGVVPVLQVLALGGAFQVMDYINYWAFIALGRTSLQLRLAVPARLVMIVLCILGARMGAVGAAWGMTGGLILIWLVNSLLGLRMMDLPVALLVRGGTRPLATWGGLFVALAAANHLLSDYTSPWMRLIASVGVSVLYVVAAVAFVPALRGDAAFLVRVAKRLR